ncbi:hypothetical protein Scep_021612 [Stephania cephalantha]|uniref:Uncharacterized protein n=1 Tax=Stephania cephalantha TaxID=152367 RepID=A0AAP0FBL7_9MAGN
MFYKVKLNESYVILQSLPSSSRYPDYSSNFVQEGPFRKGEEAITLLQRVSLNLQFVLVTKKYNSGEGSRRGRVSLGCENGGIYKGLSIN